jgi:hypothetical protein
MILRALADSELTADGSLAGYAAVSPEWQAFFEGLTFRNIYVQAAELHDVSCTFERAFADHRRRRYVKFIGLRLEFSKYEEPPSRHGYYSVYGRDRTEAMMARAFLLCRNPITSESAEPIRREQRRHSVMFSKAMALFLRQMSGWKSQQVSPGGIALELIGDSASCWQTMAQDVRARQLPNRTHVWSDSRTPPGYEAITIPQRTWDEILHKVDHDFYFTLGYARCHPSPLHCPPGLMRCKNTN